MIVRSEEGYDQTDASAAGYAIWHAHPTLLMPLEVDIYRALVVAWRQNLKVELDYVLQTVLGWFEQYGLVRLEGESVVLLVGSRVR